MLAIVYYIKFQKHALNNNAFMSQTSLKYPLNYDFPNFLPPNK